MAKGNLFQGTGTGKIGDVVLSRRNGEQVSRVRVRTISNPRSLTQVLQRVVVATAVKAYSLFSPICDHSFQGKSTKMQNMQRFQQLNTRLLTTRANDAYNAGTMAQVGDYVAKDGQFTKVNEYVISEGSAPSAPYVVSGVPTEHITLNADFGAAPTYGDVIEKLSLKEGDQLTFISGIADATTGDFKRIMFCRVILSSADGSLDAEFLGNNGALNGENPRNEGTSSFTFTKAQQGNTINVVPKAATIAEGEVLCGGALIVSYYEGNMWHRSNEVFSPVATEAPMSTLQNAIDSWMTEAKSSKYLNQGIKLVF